MGLTIKGKWSWSLLISLAVSVAFNVTLIKMCFYFQFMPMPDGEVTQAYQVASSSVVANKTFNLKWGTKYLLLVETTKDEIEKLKNIQRKKLPRKL